MKYQISQLRDYSSLFTRSEVLSWLKMDFTSLNYKIERYDENWIKSKKTTYLEYLKYVYSVLAVNYQNEYIFKNEFLNAWLISELGEENSKLFSEFSVGISIADLAMCNGISKVFEIKTEFDSDSRLHLQLESYKKAFNQIYLIVPESKLNIYEKQEETVGLITFNSNNDHSFSVKRNATTTFDIDPSTIMTILHASEYKSIVKKYIGYLPEMTSFSQFKTCSALLSEIPKSELNALFVSELKNRGNNIALSSRNHKEFNQLSLALKMNRTVKNKMIDLLKTPIQF